MPTKKKETMPDTTELTTALAAVTPLAEKYPVLAPAGTAELAELLNDNVGSAGFKPADLDRIKIPSGDMRSWVIDRVDGLDVVPEVEGIIVAWRMTRAYWKSDTSGGGAPPDCVSKDSITGAGDPGGVCAQCPFASFGTGKGGFGQACKQMRELLIILPGQIMPVFLRVPPTSLQNAGKYFLRLASKRINYWAAITRFKLESATSKGGIKYARAVFELAAQVGDEERARMRSYHLQMQNVLNAMEIAADLAEESGRPSGPRAPGDDDIPF